MWVKWPEGEETFLGLHDTEAQCTVKPRSVDEVTLVMLRVDGTKSL